MRALWKWRKILRFSASNSDEIWISDGVGVKLNGFKSNDGTEVFDDL